MTRHEGELLFIFSETFRTTVPVSDVVFELVLERKNYVSSKTPHTISSELRGVGADRGRRERSEAARSVYRLLCDAFRKPKKTKSKRHDVAKS